MICLLCLFTDEFTEKLENFKNQTPAMSEHQLTTARDIRRRGEGGFKYRAILLTRVGLDFVTIQNIIVKLNF